MDRIRRNLNILFIPVDLLRKMGAFAFDRSTREYTDMLEFDEPLSRASKAIGGAERAAERGDTELTIFEVLRAANAVEEIAKYDSEKAKEIGPKVADAALKLPDGDLEARVAEQAIAKGLDTTVGMLNENIVLFPQQDKNTDT